MSRGGFPLLRLCQNEVFLRAGAGGAGETRGEKGPELFREGGAGGGGEGGGPVCVWEHKEYVRGGRDLGGVRAVVGEVVSGGGEVEAASETRGDLNAFLPENRGVFAAGPERDAVEGAIVLEVLLSVEV